MNDEIMVSVSCLVYNHAKYLRKCLDGFVMQKTDFKFEVLVHDDASTDGSQDIIREYEEKYPDIIKPIYQAENQYSKKTGISKTFQYPRVKGKYLAECEGDDYWCDEYKLQKQFDALENNPDCVISTAKVQCINEAGDPIDRCIPDSKYSIKAGVQDSNMLISLAPAYLFQTSSYMYNAEKYITFIKKHPDLTNIASGDRTLTLSLFSIGKCYYFDEIMSKYRVGSVGSWSVRNNNINNRLEFYRKSSVFYKAYIHYLSEEYAGYDELNLSGMRDVIDYYDVYYATLSNQYKLLFTKEYRGKMKRQLTLKNRVICYFIAIFPRLSKGYVKKYV